MRGLIVFQLGLCFVLTCAVGQAQTRRDSCGQRAELARKCPATDGDAGPPLDIEPEPPVTAERRGPDARSEGRARLHGGARRSSGADERLEP